MNSMAFRLAIVGVLTFAVSAFADTHYWKPSPEDNWNWTNPKNFDEDSAPSAGDIIVVREGLVVHLKSDDAASWAVATDPNTVIQFRNFGSYAVYEVGEGLDVTNFSSLSTAWGNPYQPDMDNGGLRKTGLGKLTLRPGNSGAEFKYYTKLACEEGELVLAVGGNQNLGVLSVADGATITITGSFVTLAGYEGSGTIRRTNVVQDYLNGPGIYEFSGKLAENMYPWCGNRQLLTGTDSTLTNVVYSRSNNGKMANGPYVGVAKFGLSGQPSSIGPVNRIVLAEGSGGVRYLGTGETTTKNIELDTTLTGPSFIDGGVHGGLVWNGNLNFSSWRGQAVSFAFIGDNETPCTFGGKLHDQAWTYRTAYITKDGTGTWLFSGTKHYTADIGGIAVKNGILQFDSIAEKGTDCALGTASKMTEDFSGTDPVDAHLVPYAYVLGGTGTNGLVNTTALLEYVGTTAAKVTTRPAVLNGRGGFKSSTAAFDFTGVTAKGTETDDILLLDGDGSVVNTIRDVTDGTGKVGVEKNGTGTWVLAGNNDFSGPVTVNAGTLRLASTKVPYRWYRFNIKELQNSKDIMVGYYLGFYDEDGRSLTDGFTKGTSAAALAAKQAYYWGANNDFYVDAESVYGKDLGTFFVFNGDCWGGYFLKNRPAWTVQKFDVDDETTWARVLVRLPDDANPVVAYDFLMDGGAEWKCKYGIKTWSLDASVDGQTWTEVSATASRTASSGAWGKYWASNNGYQDMTSEPLHKTGMQIASHVVTGTLPTTHEWSVAEDATLVNEDDESLTVSKLTVDATKGVGKFSNFAFAETGTVDVRNVNFEKGVYEMSFTSDFSESEGFSNVANWTFLVDGKVSKKYTVSVSGSTITVTKNVGTLIILR